MRALVSSQSKTGDEGSSIPLVGACCGRIGSEAYAGPGFVKEVGVSKPGASPKTQPCDEFMEYCGYQIGVFKGNETC